MRLVGLCGVIAACGGGSDDEATTDDGGGGGNTQGACGAVGTATVQVLGRFQLADDSPAGGAAARLEERNWNSPDLVYTTGISEASGQFDLTAEIVTVADCWGSAVDYYVVGELGGAVGELAVNAFLFNAVEGTGAGIATIELPIILEGAATIPETGGSGSGSTTN